MRGFRLDIFWQASRPLRHFSASTNQSIPTSSAGETTSFAALQTGECGFLPVQSFDPTTVLRANVRRPAGNQVIAWQFYFLPGRAPKDLLSLRQDRNETFRPRAH